MRQLGWIALFALLVMVACGPPEVTDIGDTGPGTTGDDDDDDDLASDTIATGTTPPGGSPGPTLTNVPSFATWNSTIRPLLCTGCHTGGSGGFPFSGNPSNAKSEWFQSICNRAPSGVTSYNPPAGRWRTYMTGNDVGVTHGSNPNIPTTNATTVNNWLMSGTATPPSCYDYYDLANSS